MRRHSRVVQYNGRTYRALPKHDDIELGHIRKMVRYLQVEPDCAAKHIPDVYPKLRAKGPLSSN